jgi:hypothetical protein
MFALNVVNCDPYGMYMDIVQNRGLYIGKYPPPWGGGEKYQPMSFGGKNMKRWREKEGKM